MSEPMSNELSPRVQEALRAYHRPPPPPLRPMWQAIERGYFGAGVHTLPRWLPAGLAAAAALMLGIAIGHFSPFAGPAGTPVAQKPPAPRLVSPVADQVYGRNAFTIDASYGPTANQFFGQTAAFLAVLPGATGIGERGIAQQVDVQFAAQAAELLSTTRMLLDSAAVDDAELQDLLLDLELILAQVASLTPTRSAEELHLITATVREREVLPRLRKAALRTVEGRSGDYSSSRRKSIESSM